MISTRLAVFLLLLISMALAGFVNFVSGMVSASITRRDARFLTRFLSPYELRWMNKKPTPISEELFHMWDTWDGSFPDVKALTNVYTLTTLADGRVQFDWGSKYHTRSGFDDRMWSQSTYDGLAEIWAKGMGYKSAKEADDAFANSLTSNCVRVTSLSGLWKK